MSTETSDDKFKTRADSIFGCLDSLEQKHKETVDQYNHDDQLVDVKEPIIPTQGSSESRYRRNQTNRNRLPKRVPDHVVNPKKWTKYR